MLMKHTFQTFNYVKDVSGLKCQDSARPVILTIRDRLLTRALRQCLASGISLT